MKYEKGGGNMKRIGTAEVIVEVKARKAGLDTKGLIKQNG